MSEHPNDHDAAEQPAPQTEAPTPPSVPDVTGTVEQPMDAQVVADGKTFAILCYAINFIGFPFWLLPLIMRDNEFSLYHAKQCLLLWLFGAVGYTVGAIGIMCVVGIVILPVVLIAMLVFNILGLLNAINGKAAPLPIIGGWAVEWFKGIKVQPKTA